MLRMPRVVRPVVVFLVAMGVHGLSSAVEAEEPAAPQELPPAAAKTIDFVSDIQPLLARSCLSCHGPEEQEGGLRLHRKEDALRGGDRGAAIVAGKSAQSRLIHFVAGINEEETLMPPEGEGQRLSPEQIGLLRAWIDQGANWPDGLDLAAGGSKHWAFEPIADLQPPQVRDKPWVRNEIDQFVLAELESMNIRPSPEADKVTLVRRLYLDLLGLPPSTAEIDEHLNDTRDDAYEQLVTRLLNSPHYGERWGRHWLDLARYADSDGYEKDTARPFAWRWRNWVIDAFNRDLPFDRFTIEQLAGDLLPEATLAQQIATGFHRNTLVNKEGGVDQEEFRVKAVVDRVNTTGTVWLGLTVGCAQCHSHKYDPIAQREFYGLFAFFNSVSDVDIPAPLPEQAAAYEKAKEVFDRAHAPYLAAIAAFEKEKLPERLAAWETTAVTDTVSWTVLQPASAQSAEGAKLAVQKDHSILAAGKNPDKDTYTLKFRLPMAGVTAIRLEALPDDKLPAKGPGRVKHGNFVLSEFRASVAASDSQAESAQIAFSGASADFAQGKDGKEFPPEAAIDGKPGTGWAVSPQFGRRHVAVFELAAPLAADAGQTLMVTLDQQHGQQHTLGKLRLSVTDAAGPVKAVGLPDEVVRALQKPREERTKQEQAAVVNHYKTVDPEMVKLTAAAAEHARKTPVDPATTTKAQAFAELPQPRATHVMIRGDFLRKGDEVQPHALAVLHPLEVRSERPTRLDLARWLVDPQNPLTPRVTVNRVWQAYFGRGLVATPDDFGKQGAPPTHPRLLDWLAREFVRRGWSFKQLHKLILTSATYRQSSAARPDLEKQDPQNVWLARQVRFRVEAEVVRDLTLAASGLLNRAIGGPSVRPPQPAGISELTYAGAAKWVESKGADRYRRGMYTHFQRTSPYPMLMTFDAPDSNVCVVRRDRSNTPLQALTLLNDATFFEAAQALARRILAETPASDSAAGVTTDRLRYGFRLCLARQPSAWELERLEQLYQALLAAASSQPEEASKLAGDKPPVGLDIAEAAAWVAVSRTLLNLDEFVTRE
jgi:hypothetical protein